MFKVFLLSSLAFVVSCRSVEKPLSTLVGKVPAVGNPLKQVPTTLFAHPNVGQCDLQKLSKCGQDFFKSIGYTGDPGDAKAFFDFLGKKCAGKEKQCFDDICAAVSKVGTCYGQGLQQCFTIQNFESLGLDRQSATEYALWFSEVGVECASQKVIDDNWDCIIKTQTDHQHEMQACSKKFEDQVRKDPQGLCKYAQEFLMCDVKLYDSCGDKVKSVICETMKAGLDAVMPCTLNCGSSSLFTRNFTRVIPAVITKVVNPKASVGQCDEAKLTKCGETFFKDVGYEGDPKDVMSFFKFLEEKMGTTAEQQKKVFHTLCVALNNAQKCYGPGLDDCLTVDNFAKLGFNRQAASTYSFWFSELFVECANEKIIDDNYDCILKVNKESEPQRNECVKKFEDQIRKDPQNLCKYAQQYLLCLSNLYTACGSQVEDVLCKTFKAGFEKVMPCKLMCTSMSTSGSFFTRLAPEYLTKVSTPKANAVQCDEGKFVKCGETFFKDLGYQGDPKNSVKFFKFLEEKYGTTAESQQKEFDFICGALTKAKSCFGPGCITVENFEKLGFSRQAATEYTVWITETSVQCANQKTLDDNFDCIFKVSQESKQQMEECTKKFADEVRKDPQNLCKYAQELLSCIVQPYHTCGPAVMDVLCKSVAAAFEKVMPCKFVCPKSDSQTIMAQCNLDKLKTCGLVFFKTLGYTGDPADFDAFKNFLMNKYNTKEGFDNICEAWTKAKNCFGDFFIGCITVGNLQALGLDLQTASSYTILLTVSGTECKHKKVLDDNFDCAHKADLGSRQHEEQCGKTFEGEIRKDPKGICKYGQEFLKCLVDPFTVCGDQVTKVVCESMQASIEKTIPCHLNCA